MGKFWAVFKREYLERVRTKWFIISTVFFPVLMAGLMVVPALISARSMRDASVGRIDILDATGVGLGRQVQTRLARPTSDPDDIRVQVIALADLAAAESLATQSVQKKERAGYLVLDTGTVASAVARYAGRNASEVGQIELIERTLRQTILTRRLEGEGLDPQRIEALTRVAVSLRTERITDRGRGGSAGAQVVLGIAVGIVLYMSLIIYGQATLRSVLEEKMTRVAEVIVASIKTDVLLAGKVIGVAAVAMTQLVFWIVSAVMMYMFRTPILGKFGVTAPQSIPLPEAGLAVILALLAFFVLGFLFYSSLFAAAGATVNSDQDAQQAATPIMMLIVVSFIFMQPVLLAPNSTLAVTLSWLPFSAPIIMPIRMSIVPLSPLEVGGVLAMLVVATGAAVWASSRIYRVGLLMYGKRPTVRELGRWIAQS